MKSNGLWTSTHPDKPGYCRFSIVFTAQKTQHLRKTVRDYFKKVLNAKLPREA